LHSVATAIHFAPVCSIQSDYDMSRESDRLLGRKMASPADCKSALATRQMWAYPILVAGGLVILGVAVVRSSNRHRPA
jgi:hypothetical protein